MGNSIFDEIHRGKFGKTQEQIINDLHYDKGAMTRIMQSLEQCGLVIRKNNPGDSRSFVFHTTAKADAFKPRLIEILRKWNSSLLDGIEHADIIKEAVSKMSRNARRTVLE